jgi:hypothetical protein
MMFLVPKIVLNIVVKFFFNLILKFIKMKKFLILGAFAMLALVSCKEKAAEAPVEYNCSSTIIIEELTEQSVF